MDTSKFLITGFADEIDPLSLDHQLAALGRMDIHYIELRFVDGKNIVDCTDDELAVIEKKLSDAGIRPSSIGSPIGKIKIDGDFEAHFERFCRTIDIAVRLGAPYIRMFSFYIPEDEDCMKYKDTVIKQLARLVEYAADKNIVLLHENEKGIFGHNAETCRMILDTFGSDHFKTVFDFANFVQCGQDPMDAYRTLAPHIAYVHIKDALFSNGSVVPPGCGDGQLETILRLLAESGYEGFLSLEPHLSDVTGFGTEESVPGQEFRKLSGEDAFRLAYDSLKEILNRL